MMYKCPICDATLSFTQKATVLNCFNGNGHLVGQRTIRTDKKIHCDMCGFVGKEELFIEDDEKSED